MKFRGLAMALCGAAMLLGGCATLPAGNILSVQQFEQQFPATAARLGPGDRVRIGLYGDDALTGEYDVAADGTVSLPLVGAVPASGLDIEQFRTGVEQRLAQGFYQNPRISAQVVNVQPIYVLGEVNRAGSFPYAPDMTVSKAAALAGGYTYRARMDVIAVRRARAATEVLVQADQSMALAPGDTVRFLERYF